MKMLKLAGLLAVVSVVSTAYAQKGSEVFPKPENTNRPPPDVIAEPPPARLTNPPPKPVIQLPKAAQPYAFECKPLAGRAMVLTSEQAQGIIDRFKTDYMQLESPRLLIYVSRDLAAPVAGGADDPQAMPDVQGLFTKPFQAGGATLADQNVAAALLAGKPIETFTSGLDTPQIRKEREALSKVADVIIEVVLTSKTVPASSSPDAAGIAVPEIQSKAVRLNDSKVIAQGYSTLMTNRIPPAKLATYDVRELAEVAALALMEQM